MRHTCSQGVESELVRLMWSLEFGARATTRPERRTSLLSTRIPHREGSLPDAIILLENAVKPLLRLRRETGPQLSCIVPIDAVILGTAISQTVNV